MYYQFTIKMNGSGDNVEQAWREAIEYVRSHDDHDNLDREDIEAAYTALYGPPDDQDREEGLWSHCCAYVQGIDDNMC